MMDWLWQAIVTNGLSATAGAVWRRSTGGEIKIVSPREGEVAQPERREAGGDNAYRVRGRLKSKSPKDEVWVLLEDESTGRVWPQERAEYVSGEWSALVWGMKKPKAKIIAVVAGPTEHEMFSYYLKNGEKTGWAPLNRLPVTIANKHFVRVKVS